MPANPTIFVCAYCGSQFARNRPRHRSFCSQECYRASPKYRSKSLADRFWERVNKTDGCWEFTHLHKNGYGQIWSKGRMAKAHRISWELHFGTIPDNMLVCHHCDNPACIRPDHLFLGTPKDNMHDAQVKGRNYRRDQMNPRCRLTEDDVRQIRQLSAAGVKGVVLAARYKVFPSSISAIVRRKTWRHIE